MTSDPNPTASKGPGLLIAGAFFVVLGSIGTCAYVALAPKGDRVGEIDLVSPAPSVVVTLARPSALSFRLDATLPSPTNENSSRATRNAVYDTLGESTIELTDTPETGGVRTARCAAYAGSFVSASDSETEVAVHGIPVTCAFESVAAGRHTITATATWARRVTARVATLEVRARAR